jgi:hypothetical protein
MAGNQLIYTVAGLLFMLGGFVGFLLVEAYVEIGKDLHITRARH